MYFRPSVLVLAATAAASSGALAQSSVTIFGAFDVNVRVIDNDRAKQTQLATDGSTSSRLGFMGTEDLGGGLATGFRLEGATSPDTGGATLFTRRSTVSLIGALGEIRLGRDYTASFWNWTVFDPFQAIGLGNSLNLATEANGLVNTNGGYGTLARSSNSFGYFLPANLGGFYGQVMLAPREDTDGNKYTGGRFGYASGPINIAVSASETEVSKARDLAARTVGIGASYKIADLTLSAFFNRLRIDNYERRNWLVGVQYPIGPWELKAAYSEVTTRNQVTGMPTLNGGEAKQLALGTVYNLSKRTGLYANYSRIDNGDGSAFRVSQGPTLKAGDRSQGYELGIRHAF